ncbi:MAG: hypothetical protein JXR88_13580 [Clostridia bacterium]|nr:hypothetical protein [Clostridia bacterium]
MDDNNIDLLIKKRSEEIKKEREEQPVTTNTLEDESIPTQEHNPCQNVEKKLRRMQKWNLIWKLLALVLVIGVNVLWFMTLQLNNDVSDLKLEVLSLLEDGKAYYFNDMLLEETSLILLDNRTLIDVNVVMDYIDNQIHYSNSGTRVYIPLENISYELETPALTEFVKKNIVDINVPIVSRNDKDYIDFEVIQKLYDLDVFYGIEGSFIIYNPFTAQMVSLNSDVDFVKTSHGLKQVGEGEGTTLGIVLDTHENLSRIFTENGRIGYVETAKLATYQTIKDDFVLNEIRAPHDYGDDIHVTWNQISSFSANPNLTIEPDMDGVDVISPTWFSLNINGIIISEADFRYVKDAHEKGLEVWGLFSNSFKPDWTSDMLNEEVYRKKTIAQIAFFVSLYDLDGVNIDFENMYLKDQDAFTVFMADLYDVLLEQNVVLSVDMTVPGGSDQWSKVYDRLNIAKHVDYIMLMAYDEFWASSDISGPVASIPWVEKGIVETLALVPKDKLILGMPLYMRVWIESGGSVTSKSIGIKHLEGVLEDQDYELSYDEENQINYISYRSDGKLYRIWLEDETSIQRRIELVNEYKLPGIGTWSKEFVKEDTYSIIREFLE